MQPVPHIISSNYRYSHKELQRKYKNRLNNYCVGHQLKTHSLEAFIYFRYCYDDHFDSTLKSKETIVG